MSIVRAVTVPLRMSSPARMNVARMLVLPARFWTSGTYPCWPKKCDGAISVPGVAASNSYGVAENTTRSPVRVG